MSDNRLDKTTLGLPLFLEDTTGFWQGPTDFFDIYDRPPFIHVRNRVDLVSRRMRIDIFELETTVSASTTSNNDSSSSTRVPVTPRSSHSRYGSRSGISLHLEPDVHGNIVCMNSDTRRRVAAESWLCKCESGGRQFQASDGEIYRWSFRNLGHDVEWTCINMGRNEIVAHYDLKSEFEPPYSTSGNVLIIYELWTDLAIEFVASLIMMRHLLTIGAL